MNGDPLWFLTSIRPGIDPLAQESQATETEARTLLAAKMAAYESIDREDRITDMSPGGEL